MYGLGDQIRRAVVSVPSNIAEGFGRETDKDFKRLVDNLRTYGLRPYYLSRQFRNDAIRELDKVCWAEQPAKTRIWYKMPVLVLKSWTFLLRSGAKVKKRMACPIS